MSDESRKALAESYMRAEYWVEVEPAWCLHVGQRSSPLDALLTERGAQAWALITAHNPRSQRLPDHENAQRAQALAAAVRRLGYFALRTRARDKSGQWPDEQGLLVLDIRPAEAVELGRRFDQNAILVGRRGAAVELRWLGPAPHG